MADYEPYDPKKIEAKWYDVWEEAGYFRPAPTGKPYCIVIPPPNVTGSLHIGHALNNTLQDILVRYKRMDGYSVLWQPGLDHAGIATQKVVSDLIKKQENKSRYDYGREEFLKRIWAWKEESGGIIVRQLKRLGATADWSRERFTMDEGLSRAVRQAFVTLFEKRLLERDLALNNWCPGTCKTVLSDLEVEHEDIAARPIAKGKTAQEDYQSAGRLYHIKYPLAEAVGGVTHIVVATTRPETMLGDTAVAVNPKDERYTALLEKKAKIKLPLTDRVIPLIADDYVESDFGSGAVKMTPAHDPNDFEVGKRHDLARITIFDDDAKVNENGFAYAGLDRYAARKKILADLFAAGLIEKIEGHAMKIGHCQRCATVVEPMLSTQWFVRTKTLAAPAIQAVKDGRTKFIPKEREAIYFNWMENIRDWCVSRQLWWGHQIPAWYCTTCDAANIKKGKSGITVAVAATPIVSMTDATACPKCKGTALVQDPDVLDTWFSSGTWPFSTLGWPDKTPELAKFYPTSTLVTGFDIIFFWVARMMMFGLFFKDDVPFKDVFIHGLVRDEKGEKMSKTKGNVVDPLVKMDEFGTDALRFTLAALCSGGQDIKLSDKAIEGNRNFANKLYNATRFILTKIPEGGLPEGPLGNSLFDRWILSRLSEVIASTRKALDEYRYADACSGLYQFAWGDLCSNYFELSRPALEADATKLATLRTSVYVYDHVLRMLHPVMPYLTEELWRALPLAKRPAASVMIAPYPAADAATRDDAAMREATTVLEVIDAIRNLRGEMNISSAVKMELIAQSPDAAVVKLLDREREAIMKVTSLAKLTARAPEAAPKGAAMAALSAKLELFLPLAGVVDLAAEKSRLEKQIALIDKGREAINAKLSKESYVKNAPADVVARDRAQLAELDEKKTKLEAALARVKEA